MSVNKKKLFVSNLDFDVTEDQLSELFREVVGEPQSVVIATDRESKRSKGFAFVEMRDAETAEKAIEALSQKELNGRPIRVCEDRGKGGGAPFRGGESREGGAGGGEGRPRREILPPIQRMTLFRRKRKLDPFLDDPSKSIDYRDIGTLRRFLSDRGKILSRRMTGLSAYNQRQVKKAIKRAQSIGLLPYSS